MSCIFYRAWQICHFAQRLSLLLQQFTIYDYSREVFSQWIQVHTLNLACLVQSWNEDLIVKHTIKHVLVYIFMYIIVSVCKGCVTFWCHLLVFPSFRLSPAPEKASKYQWTFKLVHLQPEKRTYYFSAYSEKEMTVRYVCILVLYLIIRLMWISGKISLNSLHLPIFAKTI